MLFNYFDIVYVIEIYDFIINELGGLYGIRDIGFLESVLNYI